MSKYVWDNHDTESEYKRPRKKEIKKRQENLTEIRTEKRRRRKRFVHRRRQILIIIIFIFLSAQLFIPYLKIEQLSFSETSLLKIKSEDIKNEIGERASVWELFRLRNSMADDNLEIERVNATYNFRDQLVEMKITEVNIIGYQKEGPLVYSENDKIETTEDLNVVAPVIDIESEKMKNEIYEQLSTLDYTIIEQIKLITPHKNKNTVIMYMDSGQQVEIKAEQISTKMPHYLQMEAIINEENDGETGIIHLDVGDYYEPK